MVDTLFKLLPYGPGQILLGRECQAFTLYSSGTPGTPELAVQIGPGKENALINPAIPDRLFLERTPFITGNDVLNLMGRRRGGRPRRILGDLIEVGVIQPAIGASRGSMTSIYSKPQIERALVAFVARFEPVDPLAPGMVGIYAITSSYGMTSKDLWKLPASGDIRRMGMIAEKGFLAGMRLELAEMLAVMAGVQTAIQTRDIAKLLDVHYSSVRKLAAEGCIAYAPGRTDLSTSLLQVFDGAVVEAFHTEFISGRRWQDEQAQNSK